MKKVQILLFFLLFYIYLWIGVDLRLIYHGGGMIFDFPVFYRGWDFFARFLRYPGGPAEYVSGFLAQFFSIGWAGAMIVTIQAWLVWLCTNRIIRAGFGKRFQWVGFIPAIVMLIPYSRYSYQFGATTVVLTAMIFVCLYFWTASKEKPSGLAVFVILSATLYWITGWGYCVFTVLCVTYEVFIKRRRVKGLIYLLASLAVLYAGQLLFLGANAFDTSGYFQPYSYITGRGTILSINILYVFLLVDLLLLLFFRFFGASLLRLTGQWEKLRARFVKEGTYLTLVLRTALKLVEFLLPFVIGIVVAGFSYNDKTKTLLDVDYFASQRKWQEVLSAAEGYPQDILINHAVDRALYHTGRLSDDMFAYPQNPDALFLSSEKGPVGYWRLFDTYTDLGQMNMAAYSLIQAIESYGEQPMLLKRLAMVNMIRGNTGSARVYLGALQRTLFDAGQARIYLEKIEQDPNLSADKDIQQLRSTMAEKDKVHLTISADLFTGATRNKMAFEYLMAFYLLEGDFDRFLDNLPRVNDFNYTRIPRTYEEAILYYNYTRNKNIGISGREISPESRKRFDGFTDIYIGKYKGDGKAAFDELAKNYGDSYMFYCVYRQSGMKK